MDNEEAKGMRITLKRKRPNPLFQEWLEELHEEAKSKQSKLETMLNEALQSLSKYPLPLQSGTDCLILKGFDRKLCKFLDKRLEVYTSNNVPNQISTEYTDNISDSQPNTIADSTSSKGSDDHNIRNSKSVTTEPKTKKQNSPGRKKYKPVFRSGSYAILITLLEHSKQGNNALKKDELIEKAQKYSEESFVRPKPESFYTAWSNMSALVKKGLVIQSRGKKAQYSLTDEGVLLAEELLKESKNVRTVNDMIFNGASSNVDVMECESMSQSSDVQRTDSEICIEMEPGSFDIILLIDKNETGGLVYFSLIYNRFLSSHPKH